MYVIRSAPEYIYIANNLKFLFVVADCIAD